MKIYTITVLTEDGKSNRTMGFYFNLEAAKKAVSENRAGLDECRYHWVVIEQFKQGVMALAENKRYWFQYCKVPDRVIWEECEEPEFARGLVNFGIG